MRELDNPERQMAGILCACIRPEPHIGEHQIPCPSCRAAVVALVDGTDTPAPARSVSASDIAWAKHNFVIQFPGDRAVYDRIIAVLDTVKQEHPTTPPWDRG